MVEGHQTLTCPACGKENRAEAGFCQYCGNSLMGVHPQNYYGQNVPSPGQVYQQQYQPNATVPQQPISQSQYAPPSQPMTNAPIYPQQQVVVQTPLATGLKNNGLCVASMVLGILAVVFLWVPYFGLVLSILAVVLGAVGIGMIQRSEYPQGGKGMGIAGLVMGLVGLAANIAFIAFVASI